MTTRILVVDNNKYTLEIIEQILLANLDCQVETACSGRGALAKIKRQTFDLLILDVMMPDMHGVRVCQSIAADQRLKKLPVLLMSALPLTKAISQTQKEIDELVIIKEVLEKPFGYQALLTKVKKILGEKWQSKKT